MPKKDLMSLGETSDTDKWVPTMAKIPDNSSFSSGPKGSGSDFSFAWFQIQSKALYGTTFAALISPLTVSSTLLQATPRPNGPLIDPPAQPPVPKEAPAYAELSQKGLLRNINLKEPAPLMGYREVFAHLGSQNFKAFYKGFLLGNSHVMLSFSFKLFSQELLDFGGREARICLAFLSGCAIDLALQPLRVLQTRFILQDRRYALATYKGILDAFRKHSKAPAELFSGARAIAPLNAVQYLSLYFAPNIDPLYLPYLFFLINGVATFPLQLAARRLEAQSSRMGMLKSQHKTLFSVLKSVWRDEGKLCLYRGFAAMAIANIAVLMTNTTLVLRSRNLN